MAELNPAPARDDGHIRWWELLPLLGTGAILTTCMLSYKGYIKDDAFISLRYARNLAAGNGMVFNVGEQVEGYTNFLWIVLSAPAFWVGADPVSWIKVMGAMCSLAAMVQVFLMARWLNGNRPSAFHYIPPLLLASSTSVALWAMSGMAPCLMLVLGTSATFHLWRALDEGKRFDFVMAGLAMALAALTRPEGHVFFIAGVIALGVQAIRRRRIAPEVWWFIGAFSILVAPYHIWRYAYFGYLLPNTYYAKATAGREVWGAGVEQLGGFMGFNVNGALAASALLALIPARKRVYRAVGLALVVFFMLYLIKIGRDEMKHYRLFLPVYGLFVLMAGEGLRGLCEAWKGWQPRWLSAVPAFALALVPVVISLQYTKEHRYEDGYLKMSRNSFQKLGEYIVKNSDTDDTAIFQDMGACPYAAWPIRFVDPIGVLNPFVAHELAAIRCNPFLRGIKAQQPGGRKELEQLDQKIRDHLFEQDARWIGMVAYVSKGGNRRSKFRKSFDAKLNSGDVVALEKHLGTRLRGNSHHHGLYNDPRFAQRYEYETCWRRNNGYYLVLYQRKP